MKELGRGRSEWGLAASSAIWLTVVSLGQSARSDGSVESSKAPNEEAQKRLVWQLWAGKIGEERKDTLKGLNYNTVFTYAVKAIQELSDIVKQQQEEQIDAQKQQIDRLIDIILNAWFYLFATSCK